ncbi:hypothetical protein FRC11_009181, partial [Ceratobasidium sp. 423]
MEQVEAMEEAQHSKENQLATQSVAQPQTEPEQYVLQYISSDDPVDIAMSQEEQLSKNLKQQHQDMDTRTAKNTARDFRQCTSSILPSVEPTKVTAPGKRARQTFLSNVKAASQTSAFTNDEDYGSDMETVAALYENKWALKDETIGQVMTLLSVLVKKVNHLLDMLPSEPTPVLKNVHPVVAQHLVASGQRHPAAPQDNFKPWDQTEDDNHPMDPVKCPVKRVAVLAYVQVAFAQFLGHKSKKDPLPPGPPDNIESPTPKEFWVRWNEPYNSAFNAATCEIVTWKIMEDFPTLFMEDFYDDLFKVVAAHLKYNISLYCCQHLPPGDTSEAKQLLAASSNSDVVFNILRELPNPSEYSGHNLKICIHTRTLA